MQNLIHYSGTKILNSAPSLLFSSLLREGLLLWMATLNIWRWHLGRGQSSHRGRLCLKLFHAEPDLFSISNVLKGYMGIQDISERHSLITWKLSCNEGQRTVAVKGVGFMPQGPS